MRQQRRGTGVLEGGWSVEAGGRGSASLGGAGITVRLLADTCLATLHRALHDPRVLRDVRKQQQQMPQAILPLLSLGSEWDPAALWGVVCALDSQLAGVSFSADDPDDVRMLEAALDSVSAEITDLMLPAAQQLLPGLSVSRGLIDGEWAIYAVITRGTPLPALSQLSLW
jgi:hypothetical protein